MVWDDSIGVPYFIVLTSLSFIDTTYFTNQKSVAPLSQGSPSHYFSNSICLFHGFLSNLVILAMFQTFLLFVMVICKQWSFYFTTTIH